MPTASEILEIQALLLGIGGITTNQLESRSSADTSDYTFNVTNVSIGMNALNIVLYLCPLTSPGADWSTVQINGETLTASPLPFKLPDPIDSLGPMGQQSVTFTVGVNTGSATPIGMYSIAVSAVFESEPVIPETEAPAMPPISGGALFFTVVAD